jgi:hypothetical protein
MNRLIIEIDTCQGYSAGQVNHSITVGELKELLEDYSDDTVIVTKESANRYGAKYGSISNYIIDEDDI